MSKTIPSVVIARAKELIDLYGNCLEYCGDYQGQCVYLFCFPDDLETGFPFVYLYDKMTETVEEITGFDALHILSEITEEIE